MEPDRWRRLWTLFHGALERPPGEARAAFLAGSCGADAALRSELDALLDAHETGGDGLGLDLGSTDTGVGTASEPLPGEHIGPYRLVRRIGAGGMGLVFEAEQEEPVRRRVALKLVKPGLDSRDVLRRFAVERQALARMSHSSIARVFEAGAAPGGRPYFAMELVEGAPITAHCDATRLGLPRRIELFVRVCRAVQHAHQKGIIHRDLKAANVLVALEEGREVPKVIDFGIARAVEPGLEPGLGETLRGQLLGTPEAMSPEQAAMSADLDTRTDVYSLGALLYELLCGRTPIDGGDASFPELLRRIREVEPPAPSVRVAGLGAEAGAVAAARATDPPRLRRALAGELDWIVAKAMAKERERRYGSAAELADDLERQLAGRPIAAGPADALYRLRKLVRRHRAETTAAIALLAALVAFGFAMAVQARRLAQALEVQERERETAARVSDFLVELLEEPDPARARGEEVTVRQILDRGAAQVTTELAGQPEIQVRLLETIGRVQLNLGMFDAAEPALARALELRRSLRGREHPEVAAALFRLGELEFERARYDVAALHADEALEMRRRLLGEGDPAVAESLDLVALLRREAGDLAGAGELHERALAIRRAALGDADPAVAESWNYVGIVRRRGGDLAGAETAYREALGIWRTAFGDDHPRVAMAMNNLALVVHVRGDHAEAKRLFGELVPLRRRLLGPDHPDLHVTLANFGKLLHDMRDLDAAARVYEEALAVGRRALGDEHPQLASTMADYGGVLTKLGRLDEALTLEQRALAIRRAVFGSEHVTISASQRYLADVLAARGDRAGAERLFRAALELDRRSDGPPTRVAAALEHYGTFRLESGNAAGAEALLREAVALLHANLPAGDRRTARAESALGACLGMLGRFDEGEALLAASLAALAAPATPDTDDARTRLAALRAARERAVPAEPALEGYPGAPPRPISRRSQARAEVQRRETVRSEAPSAAAVSASDRPAN